VIALGASAGGAAVLALAARNPPGLRAVVNVSGGIRPLSPDGGPGVYCKPEDLVPAFAGLGERSRVPSLWLYAENDSLFPADYVRGLHEAYVAKGGRSDFHMFEPIGATAITCSRMPTACCAGSRPWTAFCAQTSCRPTMPRPWMRWPQNSG
jgi:dienelactone hydrolase